MHVEMLMLRFSRGVVCRSMLCCPPKKTKHQEPTHPPNNKLLPTALPIPPLHLEERQKKSKPPMCPPIHPPNNRLLLPTAPPPPKKEKKHQEPAHPLSCTAHPTTAPHLEERMQSCPPPHLLTAAHCPPLHLEERMQSCPPPSINCCPPPVIAPGGAPRRCGRRRCAHSPETCARRGG